MADGAARDATATFFVLAGNVRRHPDVVKRAVQEGHEIALHGDRHWPLAVLPPAGIRGEIERCAAAVADAAGVQAIHYRPPFGFMMPGQSWYVRHLGYTSVLGDVYPEDPQAPSAEVIVRRVLPRLTSGSILILHDGSPFRFSDRRPTAVALESILAEASAKGLRAVTVRELLSRAPGVARDAVAAGPGREARPATRA